MKLVWVNFIKVLPLLNLGQTLNLVFVFTSKFDKILFSDDRYALFEITVHDSILKKINNVTQNENEQKNYFSSKR